MLSVNTRICYTLAFNERLLFFRNLWLYFYPNPLHNDSEPNPCILTHAHCSMLILFLRDCTKQRLVSRTVSGIIYCAWTPSDIATRYALSQLPRLILIAVVHQSWTESPNPWSRKEMCQPVQTNKYAQCRQRLHFLLVLWMLPLDSITL